MIVVYTYYAYGLTIASEVWLPELLPASGSADVAIRYAPVAAHPPALASDGWFACQAVPGAATLWFAGAGWFVVRGGREMIVYPAPAASQRLIELHLAGNVMAVILHQRGQFVLHAAAVQIGGGAYALVGTSGQGKSSLAAALLARGHPLISDDILAISASDAVVLAAAAYPQLKIDPRVAGQLGFEPAHLPLAQPDSDERLLRCTTQFPRQPVPLRGIFELTDGPDDQLAPIGTQASLRMLVAQSYGLNTLGAGVDLAAHFRQTVAIARQVPIYTLRRRRTLARLADTAAWLEGVVGATQASPLPP